MVSLFANAYFTRAYFGNQARPSLEVFSRFATIYGTDTKISKKRL